MPDISALHVQNKSSLNNNLNNSINFNLDDLLIKNNESHGQSEVNFLNLINKEVDKQIKDKLSISNSIRKLTSLVNSQMLIEKKEIEKILDELKEFYLALDGKSGNFSTREGKELRSDIRVELISLEKKIHDKDDEITIIRNNSKNFKKKNSDLKNEISELIVEEEKLNNELEKLKGENKKEITNYNNLEEIIKDKKDEIKNLKKSNRLKKQKYEEIVQEEYSLKNQINKESLKNEDLKREISEKEKKLNIVQEKIQKLLQENDIIMEDVEILENQVKSEEIQLKELEKDLKKNKKTLDLLFEKREVLVEKTVNTNLDLKEMEMEKEMLDINIKNLEEEETIITSNMEEIKDINHKKEEHLNFITSKLEDLKIKLYGGPILSEKLKDFLLDIENNLNIYDNLIEQIFKESEKSLDINDIIENNENIKQNIDLITQELLKYKEDILFKENENNILKEIKNKMETELNDLIEKRNKIIDNMDENDPIKTKENYLEIIYNEMNNLRKIKLSQALNEKKENKKVDNIINLIKEEQNEKKKLNESRKPSSNPKIPQRRHNSMFHNTLNPEEMKSIENSFNQDNSIISGNIYNNVPENMYYSNGHQKSVNSPNLDISQNSTVNKSNFMNNQYRNQMDYDDNLSQNSYNKSMKTISMDLRSSNNPNVLYGNVDYNEFSHLKENWSKLIKDLIRMVSYFLKSSTLIMNTISMIFKRYLQKEKSFSKVRTLILKFLDKSYKRHSSFLTKIGEFKNKRNVNIELLFKCIEDVKDIFALESKSQDSITKNIKNCCGKSK